MYKKPEPQSALSLGYFNTPPKLGEVTLAWESAMPSCNTEKSLTRSYAPRNYPHSPEQIAEEIRVDEEGNLWWKARKKGRKFYNKPLGTLNKEGYLVFGFGYQTYYNHVVCFCLYYGHWPRAKNDIDHINRIRSDNRKENLREATRSQNNLNSDTIPSHNTSGYRNVKYNKCSKLWVVEFIEKGNRDIKHLKTKEEAIIWRDRVNKINHLTSDIKL